MKAPGTVDELYEHARSDLEKRERGTILRWVFWHAAAVGRLEVARSVLKRIETRDWEASMRASVYLPDSPQYAGAMAMRPTADLARAEALVTEQAACVHACAGVIELLKRNVHKSSPGEAPAVRPGHAPRGQAAGAPGGPQGQRVGQVSHNGSTAPTPRASAAASTSTAPARASGAQSGPQGRG